MEYLQKIKPSGWACMPNLMNLAEQGERGVYGKPHPSWRGAKFRTGERSETWGVNAIVNG